MKMMWRKRSCPTSPTPLRVKATPRPTLLLLLLLPTPRSVLCGRPPTNNAKSPFRNRRTAMTTWRQQPGPRISMSMSIWKTLTNKLERRARARVSHDLDGTDSINGSDADNDDDYDDDDDNGGGGGALLVGLVVGLLVG
ncbi:hypothetical protein IWX49DRAFT_583602 [Phyllosticta citricarpa]